MQNVQQCAANIVGQVLAGHNLNRALEKELQKQFNITPQDRGALLDISYGTLRHYGQLVKIQSELLNKPLKDENISNLLLIALFQLEYSKAAKYAIVDNAVQTAKVINVATAGLVNGVLRNFIRNQSEIVNKANLTDEARYSYPKWWIQKIKKQYTKNANAILEAGNLHPPMTLRINQKIKSAYFDFAMLR